MYLLPTAARQRWTRNSIALAVGVSLVAGCATDPRTGQPSIKETFASDDPCSNNARNAGIAIGAIAGAILGNQAKHSNGARLLGATLGAAAGGMIGQDMDRRRCELSKIAKQYNLDLKVSSVVANGSVVADGAPGGARTAPRETAGSVVEVRDPAQAGGHFESNSDQLTPRAQQYFSALADAYNARIMANSIADAKERSDYIAQIAKRKILLIGHTDDTGNSRLNADLSERRAAAVADYMEKRGIPKESLYFQGAGESYPVADNSSEEGRAKNRRVEIVEVADAATFDRYLAMRKPRYDYYRASETQTTAVPGPAVRASDTAPRAAAGTAAAAVAGASASRAAQPAKAAPVAGGAILRKPVAPVAEAVARPADGIDFGGVPLTQSVSLAAIGQVEARRGGFSLISSAYAAEPAVLSDCTRDRPRAAHGVKALADGKTYRTSEHLPGLYGKTWTDRVNSHQIVINKVAVLAGDGSLASQPEFKVYTNYNPGRNANPAPELSIAPDVNTYLGDKGLLYRMFFNGRAGMTCADIVFASDGGNAAKAGTLVYQHGGKPYAADFKPKIYQ
jgi:outer membrane protein OmpA-like peptidoglycan-associated protein